VLPCVDVFVVEEFCLTLRTCLGLRWGAQFADVPTCLTLRTCLAFALQTYVGARNLRTCLALRWRPACGPCGHPSCGRALRCVGAANLGEAVLKSPKLAYPSSRSLVPLVWTFSLRIGFSFGRPSCGRALRCVWAPILRTRLSLRSGAQTG
jgi:hypothetical protein